MATPDLHFCAGFSGKTIVFTYSAFSIVNTVKYANIKPILIYIHSIIRLERTSASKNFQYVKTEVRTSHIYSCQQYKRHAHIVIQFSNLA